MSTSPPNPPIQLEHAAAPCNLVYTTNRPMPNPSRRDPHVEDAFDRWTSLVEVCASSAPTTLNSFPPFPSPHLNSDNLPVLDGLPPPMVQASLSDIENDLPASFSTSADNENDVLSRNRKKHACELCDKAFDRPSTLKTHLLVHTGITPFACHLCGRRFGVQSNCNRHIRRCTIREELFITRRVEFQALQSKRYDLFPEQEKHVESKRFISRSLSFPTVSKPKRPRRKRSPTAAWIPQSLASFTIATTCSPAPVPLPPVKPTIAAEERDSYILYHDQPYTEEGWSGRLPGPAPLLEHGVASSIKHRFTIEGK